MELNLNPQQKKACEAPLKPLLIIAGAGTGKTSVLTSRLKFIKSKRGPEVCAITFTNKAAREMAERSGIPVSKKLSAKETFVGTFHSLGAKMLRKECKHFGRNSNFAIFDDQDSFSLLKKLVRGDRLAQKLGPGFFRDKISRIKDGADLSADEDAEIIREIFELYEEGLRANNAFDFDDLIQKPVELFKNNGEVLKKYRHMFRHILVDEYQDVSVSQYELVRLLASGAESLSVVGDSDQTIYSWRGSDIGIFLGFEKDWPGSNIVFLEQNYRSTANIIEAAAQLIKNNSERPRAAKDKGLWTENEKGNLIKVYEAGAPEDEADWIAAKIEEGPDTGKTAVLYRTNAQSRPLEQALLARGVPYTIYGGLKFYDRREIKDAMATLKVAANPRDSMSRERLEKAFTKKVMAELENRVFPMKDGRPLEVLGAFLKATDYFSYLGKYFVNANERRENLAELLRFASEFDSLQSFLEEASLAQATDSKDEHAVQLMTVHLAKGLEFDRVFIAGANEGVLPHARSLRTRAELEEERRLMYVAMTRARRELSITFYDLPSRFLGELPGNLLEIESVSGESLDSEERYITLD